MKKLFVFISALALAVSCNKSDELIYDVQEVEPLVLTGYSSAETRTHFGTPDSSQIPYFWSKGDYIWFIDGDDTIRDIDEIDFDADIITFSYNNYPEGDVHLKEAYYTENLYTWEMTEEIKPVLWNKFIKKSLFTSEFIEKYATLKIHTLEDGLWLCEALRHASSVKIVDKVIYFHTEGLSSKVGSVTFEQIKTLATGLSDAVKVLRDITDDEFYEKSVRGQYLYIMRYLTKTDDVEQATELLLDIIPKNDFNGFDQFNLKEIIFAIVVVAILIGFIHF